MAQVALKKAEKQLAIHATPELEAQVAQLRTAATSAQQALDEVARTADGTTTASPINDKAANKTKIEVAMLRVQVRKLEKLDDHDAGQEAELSRLRSQLAQAESELDSATDQPPAPEPKSDGEEALKKAKIALAMKRAELKKAEKAGAEETQLSKLRDGLASAEQALHDAEAQSGKPAPNLVRTDKQPIDEQTRALKTEAAFARADVRKLERDDQRDADAIEHARARLSEAERKLLEHTQS